MIKKRGGEVVETYDGSLPEESFISMREIGAGSDTKQFMQWKGFFPHNVKHRIRDGQKVLLILCEYRSHTPIICWNY